VASEETGVTRDAATAMRRRRIVRVDYGRRRRATTTIFCDDACASMDDKKVPRASYGISPSGARPPTQRPEKVVASRRTARL
jgi:hypothetical protein